MSIPLTNDNILIVVTRDENNKIGMKPYRTTDDLLKLQAAYALGRTNTEIVRIFLVNYLGTLVEYEIVYEGGKFVYRRRKEDTI